LIVDEMVDNVAKLYSSTFSPIFLCKTFGNPVRLWEFAVNFEKIDRFTQQSSTEIYYLLSKYSSTKQHDIYDLYDRYKQEETIHKYKFDEKRLSKFANAFFKNFESVYPGYKKLASNIKNSFTCITGFASASKTTKTVNKFKELELNSGINFVFVSPTKELANHHTRLGIQSYTMHNIFSINKNPHFIIIDELSQFCVEYVALIQLRFPSSSIYAIGDVEQTPSMMVEGCTTFKELGVINNLWDVYKIPQDITKLLNNKHKFYMRSHSDVEQGLKFCRTPLDDIYKNNPKQKFICFNNSTCLNLRAKKLNASTITTYTGSRDHTVFFVVDGAAVSSQLLNKPAYIYTAMTRATHQLVLYGEDSQIIKQYYHIIGTGITALQEINGALLLSDRKGEVQQLSEISDVSSVVAGIIPSSDIVTTNVSSDVASTFIDDVVKPVNNPGGFLNIQKTDVPTLESGGFSTTIDAIMEGPKPTKVYMISEHNNFVKQQLSSSTLQTIQTMVKRYGKKNKIINNQQARIMKTDLVNGLLKSIKSSGFTSLLNRLKQNSYKLNDHTADYLIGLQKKIGNNPSIIDDINDEFDPFRSALSFFNKRQTKWVPEDGYDMSDKVGQGVAAMEKKMNVIFSCYARYILTEIREIAKENGAKLILATHDDESIISDEYMKLRSVCADDKQWVCNDFSEWDSTFRSPFVNMMSDLILACGCPKMIVDIFVGLRIKWVMRFNKNGEKTKLYGNEKQFSGNPFTICENTICNMALTNALLDIKDEQMALFKGDDSAIYCGGASVSPRGMQILQLTGHIMKLHTWPVGEFAGWVLTDKGIFPDVVRYASKFLGNRYRDVKHFEEYKTSLWTRLSSVKNQQQAIAGSFALTYFYPQLNVDAIYSLFSFIKNSNKIQFADLFETNQEPLMSQY